MQKQQDRRPRLNSQIREPQIQVIDFDGKQLGIMTVQEALKIANERGLDLVEVGPQAKPPVVKIMDYGKYVYEKEKKKNESKSRKAGSQETKTVRIGFKTGIHDLKIKAGQVDKFLTKGLRVKIELTLRGREKAMAGLGRQKLEEFTALVTAPYTVDESIKSFPGGLGMLINPGAKY
jgi:translation initiation factor IF-3